MSRPRRLDVHLVCLDSTMGAEIRKTRPAVIVSPDEMNTPLGTVIIAPMTTELRRWPSRVACSFAGNDGQIALDQLRTVDKARPIERLGRITESEGRTVLRTLQRMFA